MRRDRAQLLGAWMAQIHMGRGAIFVDRRLQIGLLVGLFFSLGLSIWSLPFLLASIASWHASGAIRLAHSLWQLLCSLLAGLLLVSVLNASASLRDERQQLLLLVPIRPETLLRLFYGFQVLSLWNWLLLAVLLCSLALLLTLGWGGFPWIFLIFVGAGLVLWLSILLAPLYMLLFRPYSTRLRWLVFVGGPVLLAAGGWLLVKWDVFAYVLAWLTSISPWYICAGGVIALALVLGPLASVQGNVLASMLHEIQSLDRSPRAWMPPGLPLLQRLFERRRTLLGALFVKTLAHQGRNIFFWLRLVLLVLGFVMAGIIHTWITPLALPDRSFVTLYTILLALLPVIEVLPNALAGEGNRFILYLLLPYTSAAIVRARVLHFLLPLWSVGTASVLLLAWQYQLESGALLMVLPEVLLTITITVCVAVFTSAWDLDLHIQVEGMEQHLLQEERPFSPRRMLIFQLDLGLLLLQMGMLWRLPAPWALAGLVALAVVILPLLWCLTLAQIAGHLARSR